MPRIFSSPAVMLTAASLLAGGPPALAQMGNSVCKLHQENATSAGGRMSVQNSMRAMTCLGMPASGATANASFRLRGGLGAGVSLLEAPATAIITVTGTTNDSAASITVNGIQATLSGTTFTAPGVVLVLGSNTLTVTATDTAGNVTTRTAMVYLDLSQAKKTPRFSIHVRGTINDAAAVVKVNGVTATITNGQYDALVPVTSGYNTLTTTATDLAGNQANTSVRVFVPQPTAPPAMPTVGTVGTPPPQVTTANTATVGGTKTAGTSIWINGQNIGADAGATTWSTTLQLAEGDNWFSVVAKDAASVSSATAKINVVRDQLPPVITIPSTLKTNLNPGLITGTVDDSLTQVVIGTMQATNQLGTFTASVPLNLGPNTFTVTATSPRGLVSTKTITATRGTIPAIQSFQPIDGAKLLIGSTVTFAATATDLENDPMEYRVLLDGAPLGIWASSSPPPWTPAVSHAGLHTLTASVRDGFGGEASEDVEVYVIRPAVQHP